MSWFGEQYQSNAPDVVNIDEFLTNTMFPIDFEITQPEVIDVDDGNDENEHMIQPSQVSICFLMFSYLLYVKC